MGTILLGRGVGEAGTTRIEEAAIAFSAAIETLEQTAPLWATAQMRLGDALANWAVRAALAKWPVRETETGRIEGAIQAYQAVLSVKPDDEVAKERLAVTTEFLRRMRRG
jgi:predicted TPR repeat methyltransferase